MCGSMVNIQSATAEIRRGKEKDRRKKKPQGKNIMSASATQGRHNKIETPAIPCGDMHQSFIDTLVKCFFNNFPMFADKTVLSYFTALPED